MVGEKMELEEDPALTDPSGINPTDKRNSSVTIETAGDDGRVNEDLSIAPPVKTIDSYPPPGLVLGDYTIGAPPKGIDFKEGQLAIYHRSGVFGLADSVTLTKHLEAAVHQFFTEGNS